MATRATGFALLASASLQEAQDLALIATAATLRSRIPFLHFFDGFRTSHEIQKIELLNKTVMRSLIDEDDVIAHRQRALTPDRTKLNLHKINQQQMQQPLFEFSGACAGCGETPYLKLMSQLFGDRSRHSGKCYGLFFNLWR